ncbi:hypothetical protein CP533_5537 [Ophiocordyceps camponoti-saundersi (nom. inval.)]|nr:hypothetical protein CP533_5537 [Ophiocordyceps camponoti-saundersi (nom. inval.)]
MAPPAKKRRTTRAATAAAAAAAAAAEATREGSDAEPTTTEQAKAEPPPTREESEQGHRDTDADESKKPMSREEESTRAEPTAAPSDTASKLAVEPQPSTANESQDQQTTEPQDHQSSIEREEAAEKTRERVARFKALQARAKASSVTNFKEATKEAQRLASDPSQLTALHRNHAIASHKLLKAEVEDAGEDFERKRAWDWTVEESEKWDKRMRKKATHRDNNAFRDDQQESNKVYKRQLRNIKPDLQNYDKQKMAAIERAAASGGLDIVETEDGELIAVDKDGSFYSTADSTSFTQNKPDRAAVDRLVQDMRQAEAQRLKKRRERMANNGDEGDVTYINEKNKQFNQKLSRFYDKYTADIRDSFERGTMI